MMRLITVEPIPDVLQSDVDAGRPKGLGRFAGNSMNEAPCRNPDYRFEKATFRCVVSRHACGGRPAVLGIRPDSRI